MRQRTQLAAFIQAKRHSRTRERVVRSALDTPGTSQRHFTPAAPQPHARSSAASPTPCSGRPSSERPLRGDSAAGALSACAADAPGLSLRYGGVWWGIGRVAVTSRAITAATRCVTMPSGILRALCPYRAPGRAAGPRDGMRPQPHYEDQGEGPAHRRNSPQRPWSSSVSRTSTRLWEAAAMAAADRPLTVVTTPAAQEPGRLCRPRAAGDRGARRHGL